LPDSLARKLIHGYYACVSYTDKQIGKILKALEELGLDKNTIVVLWGDHGWNLREHGLWCKHCNFETSLHIPLIVKAPGVKPAKTEAITESVDIYPSLCDLAGLSKPAHLEGKSFVPVLEQEKKQVKNHVICKWYNGITLVKNQYFYTEWIDEEGNRQARMLYDHEDDPNETVDISRYPENEERVKSLSEELRNYWGKDFWRDYPIEPYDH
jgi:arylsulfatase A-like enzyme